MGTAHGQTSKGAASHAELTLAFTGAFGADFGAFEDADGFGAMSQGAMTQMCPI